MKKQLNFGIIGGGMIGVSHIKSVLLNGQNIAWLAEVNPALAEKVGKEFNIPNVTNDYHTMLKDKSLDAVIVGTPPFLHAPIGIEVLKAGKHLLMEKPLAHSIAAAESLAREAKKHPRLVASGCSSRYTTSNPKWLALKKIIDSGKLGRIYHINQVSVNRQGRPGIEYNPAAKWFIQKDKAGGGPLYDWGVYDMMTLLSLVGNPAFESAKATCVNGLDKHFPKGPGFVEEHGAAFLNFAGGLSYYWERAFNMHGQAGDQVRIYGTKGGVMFAYPGWCDPEIKYFFVDAKGKAAEKCIQVPEAKDWYSEPSLMKRFVAAIVKKAPLPSSFEAEIRNLRILHAVYKAAKWQDK